MIPSVLPSVRALLAGIVDYAGLFPPATLPLETALTNHAAYLLGDDRWMLGCFVAPTTKLTSLGPLLAGRFDSINPLRISALGPKADSADDFLQNLRASLDAAATFRRAHGQEVTIQQFEAPLPPNPASAPAMLRECSALLETCLPGPLGIFWEVPLSDALPATLQGIAEYHAESSSTVSPGRFGVKFRTGGTEAAAFPSVEQLAAALLGVRDAGLAVKFTAGLHHPFRHFDAALGTRMHGFVNVFAAAILAREHGLDAEEIATVIADERPESFQFDAQGFSYRQRQVSTAALRAHRQYITSFGSCSFDEPRADLRRWEFLA